MPGTTRAAQGPYDDVVEYCADHPLVVDVRASDARGHRYTATIGQDVPFYAAFRAVRRLRPRVVPSFGAFTVALSNDVHSHWIPRRAS